MILEKFKNISEPDKKEKILDNILSKLTGTKYNNANNEVKTKLKELLKNMDIQELIKPEHQGLDGVGGGHGTLTGTGKGGHYVNSVMSSIVNLINTNRLTPQVLDSLKNLNNEELTPLLKNQKMNYYQKKNN